MAVVVVDAERVHLKGLTNLQGLVLPKQITDAGLVHLKKMTKLETLILTGTPITDAGVAELQQALPNCRISSIAMPANGKLYIKKYDKDSDGKVSKEELKAHPDTPEQVKSRLDQFWSLLDTSGDGMIDEKEADAIIKRSQSVGR